MSPLVIRDAVLADAPGCREIYAPYVRDTAVSFEESVPSVEAVGERISSSLASHAWLVAMTSAGEVVGYAYGTQHRERPAYRWACDVSVYLDGHTPRRAGLGRSLYTALFARLAQRGYTTALAGVTLPNEASLGLHGAMGFEVVGTYRDIGFKNGAWHDVRWLQRSLQEVAVPPAALQ